MYYVKFILLFIWQILQNLVAICMLPFMGKKTLLHTKRYTWCILCEALAGVGSISLGSFVLLGSDNNEIAGHELGHAVDSHKMGPLYLFIIGIFSALWALQFEKGDYYDYWTERRANENSHLHSVKNGYGNYYHLGYDDGYSLDSIE